MYSVINIFSFDFFDYRLIVHVANWVNLIDGLAILLLSSIKKLFDVWCGPYGNSNYVFFAISKSKAINFSKNFFFAWVKDFNWFFHLISNFLYHILVDKPDSLSNLGPNIGMTDINIAAILLIGEALYFHVCRIWYLSVGN